MQRESKRPYDADFDRFSRFLRGNGYGYTACNSENVGSRPDTAPPQQNHSAAQPSLAMVYAVKQPWEGIYDPEIALVNGTIFEGLNKPFQMSLCSKSNGCRGNDGGRMR